MVDLNSNTYLTKAYSKYSSDEKHRELAPYLLLSEVYLRLSGNELQTKTATGASC